MKTEAVRSSAPHPDTSKSDPANETTSPVEEQNPLPVGARGVQWEDDGIILSGRCRRCHPDQN